jgi:hypothetical protein
MNSLFVPEFVQQAKTSLFDVSHWGPLCEFTLTLKQARQADNGAWVKVDEHQCKRAFRVFINRLDQAVYGNDVRRHNKRLRVLPVLEKGEARSRALRPSERGDTGRWHIHCAIELPSHVDAETFEKLINACWATVDWGYDRVLVRNGTSRGWIDYMLKGHQKSEFDALLDCIILESLHNPLPMRRRPLEARFFVAS